MVLAFKKVSSNANKNIKVAKGYFRKIIRLNFIIFYITSQMNKSAIFLYANVQFSANTYKRYSTNYNHHILQNKQ